MNLFGMGLYGAFLFLVSLQEMQQQIFLLICRLAPDILFLDIKMPTLNGFQLLEKVEVRNFFLIFTTAYSEYGIRAIKASAFDYLLKPIDPLELKVVVSKILQIVAIQKKVVYMTILQKKHFLYSYKSVYAKKIIRFPCA